MKRFQMELPDEIVEIVDEIRERDPEKPSRRQMFTRITLEWLKQKGYFRETASVELEEMKKRIAQLEQMKKMQKA